MLNIGPAEIVVILVLALLVFGPKRLPEMGRSFGRTVREFRKATESVTQELGVNDVLREVNDVKQTVTGSFDEVKQSVAGSYEHARDGLTFDTHGDEVLTGEVVDEPVTGEVIDEPVTEEVVDEPLTGEVIDEPVTAEVVDDESPATGTS